MAKNSAIVAENSAREKEIVAENSANVVEVSAREKRNVAEISASFGGCEFDKQNMIEEQNWYYTVNYTDKSDSVTNSVIV